MNRIARRTVFQWLAVAGVVLIVSACAPHELLSKASFAPETISPNADGAADATRIHYELSRSATVSIYFEAGDGQRHFFRNAQPRSAGVYDVLFGGVIDGRLLPDGEYRWTIEAGDPRGES